MTGRISSVRFTPAQADSGLLGFTSFILDGDLLIDGVAVRRTPRGELVISWPARKDTYGRLHHHVRPLDDASRRKVEALLLEDLRLLVSKSPDEKP